MTKIRETRRELRTLADAEHLASNLRKAFKAKGISVLVVVEGNDDDGYDVQLIDPAFAARLAKRLKDKQDAKLP